VKERDYRASRTPQSVSKPEPTPGPSLPLSEEQQNVVDMVLSGTSLFFTGSAGSF